MYKYRRQVNVYIHIYLQYVQNSPCGTWASKLDATRSNWLHAGKQQSTDLCAGAVLIGNTNNS